MSDLFPCVIAYMFRHRTYQIPGTMSLRVIRIPIGPIKPLVGNTDTPSGTPLCEAYHCTARPHQCPDEENYKKSPPFRDYKRLQTSVPHHIVTLRPTTSHWEVRLPSGILHKHLRRPSMMQYILLRKHLLTIPPKNLVPDN